MTNDTAVRFSQAFLQKYVDYFAGKGCRYFNFGADEYANDRYTSGSMGFGSLQSSGKYGYFIKYVNELAAMVKQAGMTPIAFNDGIEFANKMSASVGSTTYTFDRDIVVCYWSGGWSGYTPRTAANLASDGFRIINTTGDFYYVLGKNDSFDNGYTYAANWSNYKVCGTSLSASSVIGGMFCMWSDYPDADAGSQEDPPAAARHGPRHGRRLHKRHGHVRCARRLQRRRLHQHRSSRAEPRLPSDCLDGCDLHGGGQRDLYLHRLRRQLHRAGEDRDL